MKSILIPVILAVVGTGAGAGVAMFLQSQEPELVVQTDNPCGDPAATDTEVPSAADTQIGAAREYARLNNQFVVPVVQDGRIASLVVMSLSVEVTPGNTAAVFAAEPKLRDSFLQNMFDHANRGGFSGNFTQGSNMRILRNDLRQAAQRIVGRNVTDVLIIDIVRQDS